MRNHNCDFAYILPYWLYIFNLNMKYHKYNIDFHVRLAVNKYITCVIKRKKGEITMTTSENKITTQNDDEENSKSERVPIYQKMTLTIREAAEYSNIGINKIDTMLKQPGCPFVLYIGTRKLVKRKEFEKYISGKVVI